MDLYEAGVKQNLTEFRQATGRDMSGAMTHEDYFGSTYNSCFQNSEEMEVDQTHAAQAAIYTGRLACCAIAHMV